MSDLKRSKRGRPQQYPEGRSNLTIRLSPEVRSFIERSAAKNRRSLCGEIEIILQIAASGEM